MVARLPNNESHAVQIGTGSEDSWRKLQMAPRPWICKFDRRLASILSCALAVFQLYLLEVSLNLGLRHSMRQHGSVILACRPRVAAQMHLCVLGSSSWCRAWRAWCCCILPELRRGCSSAVPELAAEQADELLDLGLRLEELGVQICGIVLSRDRAHLQLLVSDPLLQPEARAFEVS